MLAFPLLAALTGCITFDDSASIQVTADLPDMDLNCDDDPTDDTDDSGRRIAADVAVVGDSCRGRAYASVSAVTWSDFADEIPNQARVNWREVLANVETLTVTADGQPMPGGVSVEIEQFVTTEATDLDEVETLGLANVDAIGTRNDDTLLFRGTYVTDDGGDANIIDDIAIDYNPEGPLDLINLSFESDPELRVITVAEVVVPLSLLEVEPTTITIEVGQAVEFTAQARLRLFGGGGN